MEWGQARSERHKREFGGQGLQAGSQGLGFRERLAWVRRSVQRRVECWQGSPQDLKSRSRRVCLGAVQGPSPES